MSYVGNMSNSGILDHNFGFDYHNYSNGVNMDYNAIAVSERVAFRRLGKRSGLC